LQAAASGERAHVETPAALIDGVLRDAGRLALVEVADRRLRGPFPPGRFRRIAHDADALRLRRHAARTSGVVRAGRHTHFGQPIDLEVADPLIGRLVADLERGGPGNRAWAHRLYAAEEAAAEGKRQVQIEQK